MEKYRQIIHIEGRSIDDIFRLPCVISIEKNKINKDKGPITVLLQDFKQVFVGDTICEDYNGNWMVIQNGKEKEVYKD